MARARKVLIGQSGVAVDEDIAKQIRRNMRAEEAEQAAKERLEAHADEVRRRPPSVDEKEMGE